MSAKEENNLCDTRGTVGASTKQVLSEWRVPVAGGALGADVGVCWDVFAGGMK